MTTETTLQTTATFLTDLQVSIGRAKVLLDKGVLDTAQTDNVNTVLADIDALVEAELGKTAGSLLEQMQGLNQDLNDAIA